MTAPWLFADRHQLTFMLVQTSVIYDMTRGEKGLMVHLKLGINRGLVVLKVFLRYNMHKHGMDVMLTVTLAFNLTILIWSVQGQG